MSWNLGHRLSWYKVSPRYPWDRILISATTSLLHTLPSSSFLTSLLLHYYTTTLPTFYGSVDRNWYFLNVLYFIPILYPLHVSAPTGHLQVDYIYISYFLRSYLTTTDLLFLYIVFALCFWRFFAVVSLYVVDMLTFYLNTLLEYFYEQRISCSKIAP
jgi:hypothetical protein